MFASEQALAISLAHVWVSRRRQMDPQASREKKNFSSEKMEGKKMSVIVVRQHVPALI
jgi:hypothetical protein